MRKIHPLVLFSGVFFASCGTGNSDSAKIDGTWSPISIGCSKSKSVTISHGIANLKLATGKPEEFFRVREIYPEIDHGTFFAEIIYSTPNNSTVGIFHYTPDKIVLSELFIDETKVYPGTIYSNSEVNNFVINYLNFERCS